MALQYTRSVFASLFDHPLLALLLVSSGVMAVVAAGLNHLIFDMSLSYVQGIPGIVPGFLGVYAILTVTLGLFGYAFLYLVKVLSVLRDRAAPHAE